MHLSVPCRDCGSAITVTPAAKSRLDLVRERGRTFRKDCVRCGSEETYHVDEISATTERVEMAAILAGLAVATIVAVVLWNRGWVAVLPFLIGAGIYGAWTREAASRAQAFNRFKVGR